MTQETYEAGVPTALQIGELEAARHGRLRWGAIFGGTIAGLGVWALLAAFGMAIGLSAIDPYNPGSLKGSGIFTGIWSAIAPALALLVGGFLASRAASVLTRGAGVMHGLVVWGLTILMGAWLVGNLISSALSGALAVGQTAVQAGSAVVAAGAQGAASLGQMAEQTFGLDANDALAPLNRRLREEGKPEITAAQLQAAAESALQGALQSGKIDRELLVRSIAENTALSRQDAEGIADRVEQQFQGARQRAQQGLQNAQTTTLKAADTTGKVLWGVFGSLCLSLIAALGGSLLGAAERMQAWSSRAQLKARLRIPTHSHA